MVNLEMIMNRLSNMILFGIMGFGITLLFNIDRPDVFILKARTIYIGVVIAGLMKIGSELITTKHR